MRWDWTHRPASDPLPGEFFSKPNRLKLTRKDQTPGRTGEPGKVDPTGGGEKEKQTEVHARPAQMCPGVPIRCPRDASGSHPASCSLCLPEWLSGAGYQPPVVASLDPELASRS